MTTPTAPIPLPADQRRLCTTCGRVDRGYGCRCATNVPRIMRDHNISQREAERVAASLARMEARRAGEAA